MAQLRLDYEKFVALDTVILVIGVTLGRLFLVRADAITSDEKVRSIMATIQQRLAKVVAR